MIINRTSYLSDEIGILLQSNCKSFAYLALLFNPIKVSSPFRYKAQWAGPGPQCSFGGEWRKPEISPNQCKIIQTTIQKVTPVIQIYTSADLPFTVSLTIIRREIFATLNAVTELGKHCCHFSPPPKNSASPLCGSSRVLQLSTIIVNGAELQYLKQPVGRGGAVFGESCQVFLILDNSFLHTFNSYSFRLSQVLRVRGIRCYQTPLAAAYLP